MIKAGLTPERARSVCKAVMKDMMSLGDVDGGCCESEKRACKGVEVEVPRVRENVCLIEAKPPRTLGEDVGGGEPGGDGGRLVCVGDIGGAARTAGLFDASPFTFFFPPNERRNDHSPSNCMVSNSLDSGE